MTDEIKDTEIEKDAKEPAKDNPETEVKTGETAVAPAAAPAPASSERPPRPERYESRGSSYRGHGGGRYSGDKKQFEDYQGDGQRFSKFRKKICKFCYDSNIKIEYKNSDLLMNFITDRGKILPRRVTGTCAKHQRAVAKEIKKARIIALLPFVEK